MGCGYVRAEAEAEGSYDSARGVLRTYEVEGDDGMVIWHPWGDDDGYDDDPDEDDGYDDALDDDDEYDDPNDDDEYDGPNDDDWYDDLDMS